MKKYYYTDLTKVIFMARHYGVKFIDPDDDTRQIRGEELLNILGEVNGGQREEPKVYVCEESWGIFEPQHLDHGSTNTPLGEVGGIFFKNQWIEHNCGNEAVFKITSRQHEHFFAPFNETKE